MAKKDLNPSVAPDGGRNQPSSRFRIPEWETKAAALEDLFFALSENPPDVPIKGLGHQLMLLGPAALQEKPVATTKALKKLGMSVATLTEALADISPEVAREMKYNPSRIAMLRWELEALQISVKAAKVNVARGAPKKIQPTAIAEVVAVHYWMITGRKPTVPKNDGKPYGPFLKLLTTVFNILGVRSSAASQAEGVYRNWELLRQSSWVSFMEINRQT